MKATIIGSLIVSGFMSSVLLGQDWNIEKKKGSVLHFSNGKEIETNLYKLKVLGKIQTHLTTYLILSGMGCEYCDDEISIYLHSPEDGNMLGESEQPGYSHPGSIYDPMSGDIIYRSKLYYGNCLSWDTTNLVWLQSERDVNGEMKKSVFVVSFTNGDVEEQFYDKEFKKMESFIHSMDRRHCIEIDGIEQAASM